MRNIPYRNWLSTLAVINLGLIAIFILTKESLPPVVPLFYGSPYGVEQLAPRSALLLPPILAIVVGAINTVLIIIAKDEFLKKVFLGGIVTATLLSLITVIKIMLLVGTF